MSTQSLVIHFAISYFSKIPNQFTLGNIVNSFCKRGILTMTNEADTKRAYQEKAKAQLDKLNAQIDELKAKSEQAKADAKIEYHDQLAKLYTKRDAAQTKLQELQQSSEAAWKDMQQGFEKAWTELNNAWKNAASKF